MAKAHLIPLRIQTYPNQISWSIETPHFHHDSSPFQPKIIAKKQPMGHRFMTSPSPMMSQPNGPWLRRFASSSWLPEMPWPRASAAPRSPLSTAAVGGLGLCWLFTDRFELMWVKQFHKPPLTGNGLYRPWKWWFEGWFVLVFTTLEDVRIWHLFQTDFWTQKLL